MKKNSKKKFASVLIMTMALAALTAGCSKNDSDTTDETKKPQQTVEASSTKDAAVTNEPNVTKEAKATTKPAVTKNPAIASMDTIKVLRRTSSLSQSFDSDGSETSSYSEEYDVSGQYISSDSKFDDHNMLESLTYEGSSINAEESEENGCYIRKFDTMKDYSENGFVYKLTYDSSYNMIKKEVDQSSYSSVTNYVYDINGFIVSSTSVETNKSDNAVYQAKYEYDLYGNILKYYYTSSDLSTVQINTYDGGRMTKSIVYNLKDNHLGDIRSSYSFVATDKKNVYKKVIEVGEDTSGAEILNEYKDGVLYKATRNFSDGTKYVCTYEYTEVDAVDSNADANANNGAENKTEAAIENNADNKN